MKGQKIKIYHSFLGETWSGFGKFTFIFIQEWHFINTEKNDRIDLKNEHFVANSVIIDYRQVS